MFMQHIPQSMKYKLDKIIYLSQGGRYSTPGNIPDQLVLSSISPLEHLGCSFMQQKQQTFGHNNIPFLGDSFQNML